MDELTFKEFEDRYDVVPGIFWVMEAMSGAIVAYELLAEKFDNYIFSTSPNTFILEQISFQFY